MFRFLQQVRPAVEAREDTALSLNLYLYPSILDSEWAASAKSRPTRPLGPIKLARRKNVHKRGAGTERQQANGSL